MRFLLISARKDLRRRFAESFGFELKIDTDGPMSRTIVKRDA